MSFNPASTASSPPLTSTPHLPWPSISSSPPHFAYVTLVTSDDFVVGAQLLSYSLRQHHNSFPLLCLVVPSLSPSSLLSLSTTGLYPVLVHPLPSPFPSHVPSWSSPGLTKLRLWLLTHYHRVLYIDSDCLVTGHLDPLLSLPTSFAAAPDLFPPTRFNAGVLLVQPSLSTYARLIRRLEFGGSYDGGDTGLLNEEWADWWEGGKETRLSFAYNAQRTMEWWTRKAGRGYWDAIGPTFIVHYSSVAEGVGGAEGRLPRAAVVGAARPVAGGGGGAVGAPHRISRHRPHSASLARLLLRLACLLPRLDADRVVRRQHGDARAAASPVVA